jgi:integrase
MAGALLARFAAERVHEGAAAVKLVDRQPVEGTERPTIYLGHRQWRDAQGKPRTARRWSAEWFLHDKQHHKSLGTNNKVAAVREAHALHRKIRQGEPTAAPREVRLVELVEGYMTLKRGEGRAPKTLEKYQSVLDDFASHCDGRGVIYGSRVTEDDFWSFEADKTLSDKTRYDRRVVILQLMKWATQRAELILKNPLRHVKMKKPEWAEQPCFTAEQVATLRAAAEPGMRDMILFLAFTGCRFGEMRDVEWGDIDFGAGSHGFVTIRRGGSDDKTKGKRSRRIPLHPTLREVLKKRAPAGERVFAAEDIGGHRGGVLVDTVFLRKLKQLCAKCRFNEPDQFKTHSFRHFFASMLARNNVSYKYALEFMGHRDSNILDLYYTMFDRDAERAIRAIKIPNAPKPAA